MESVQNFSIGVSPKFWRQTSTFTLPQQWGLLLKKVSGLQFVAKQFTPRRWHASSTRYKGEAEITTSLSLCCDKYQLLMCLKFLSQKRTINFFLQGTNSTKDSSTDKNLSLFSIFTAYSKHATSCTGKYSTRQGNRTRQQPKNLRTLLPCSIVSSKSKTFICVLYHTRRTACKRIFCAFHFRKNLFNLLTFFKQCAIIGEHLNMRHQLNWIERWSTEPKVRDSSSLWRAKKRTATNGQSFFGAPLHFVASSALSSFCVFLWTATNGQSFFWRTAPLRSVGRASFFISYGFACFRFSSSNFVNSCYLLLFLLLCSLHRSWQLSISVFPPSHHGVI